MVSLRYDRPKKCPELDEYFVTSWIQMFFRKSSFFYTDVTELHIISPTVLMKKGSGDGIQLQNVELSDLYVFLLPRALNH